MNNLSLPRMLCIVSVVFGLPLLFFIPPNRGMVEMDFSPTAIPQPEGSAPVIAPRVFIPFMVNAASAWNHYYAQAVKNGMFYGVWSTITTADPAIREPVFSYISINISDPTGHWVEVGWAKSPLTGCIPKFVWATQEKTGVGQVIDGPLPTVGVAYWYIIERTSPGNWEIRIAQTDGTTLITVDVFNGGFDYGDQIQAVGEVDSAAKLNDMGVSSLRSLHWMDILSSWYSWNGWLPGYVDSPYNIVGASPDPNNDVIVYGNNGNPIPPDAPCP